MTIPNHENPPFEIATGQPTSERVVPDILESTAASARRCDQRMTQETDENASHVDIRGGKAPITMDSKKMAWGMPHTMPIRPGLSSQQSNSLPSTPYQHARQLTFTSRSPSPTRAIYSTSPRSTHSDSSHPISSLRPALSGCKYEAGMAYSRRRMPYTLGGDLLERVAGPLKEHLDLGEAERLEQLMLKTYHALLPSEESEQKRAQFLQKLEKILNERWPGKDIKVHVFGSSGNKLCSSDSDGTSDMPLESLVY